MIVYYYYYIMFIVYNVKVARTLGQFNLKYKENYTKQFRKSKNITMKRGKLDKTDDNINKWKISC